MIFVLFADLVVIILFEIYTGVLRRGYYREFIQVLEQVILIELAAGLYLLSMTGEPFQEQYYILQVLFTEFYLT